MFVVSVSVLGELEVMVDGVVVPLPRGLARSLVMSLVVDIDRTVTDEDLIERLWGGAAPANAHFSLRNTVSRLRCGAARALGAACGGRGRRARGRS